MAGTLSRLRPANETCLEGFELLCGGGEVGRLARPTDRPQRQAHCIQITMKKLISVITPAYNEEANIDELAHRLAAVLEASRA